MTSESNAITLAQSAFEAVCKERDEALEKLSTVHCWVEKNVSGGFIDSLTHLQNLECVADEWYGRLVETIRERDEARDQLEAMRDELQKVCQQRDAWAMRCDKLGVTAMEEAIREAIDSLHKCSRVIGAPKTYDWADEDVCDAAYNSAQAALTKLQPFIAP